MVTGKTCRDCGAIFLDLDLRIYLTVVSLDLTVDEELKKEGLAREIVRNIQDARKSSGCEIQDRIVLDVTEGALPEGYADYILRETLGQEGSVASPITTVSIDDDEAKIIIAICKA